MGPALVLEKEVEAVLFELPDPHEEEVFLLQAVLKGLMDGASVGERASVVDGVDVAMGVEVDDDRDQSVLQCLLDEGLLKGDGDRVVAAEDQFEGRIGDDFARLGEQVFIMIAFKITGVIDFDADHRLARHGEGRKMAGDLSQLGRREGCAFGNGDVAVEGHAKEVDVRFFKLID